MVKINEHFYFTEDGKMENNCDKGCCIHCKYNYSKEGEWFACNQSCLASKEMIGKSCVICNHSEYGKL